MTTAQKTHLKPDSCNAQQIIKDFLRQYGKGQEMDCIQAMHKMADIWGIEFDHHEFAYALDYLARTGDATITKPGGFTRYIIN